MSRIRTFLAKPVPRRDRTVGHILLSFVLSVAIQVVKDQKVQQERDALSTRVDELTARVVWLEQRHDADRRARLFRDHR